MNHRVPRGGLEHTTIGLTGTQALKLYRSLERTLQALQFGCEEDEEDHA